MAGGKQTFSAKCGNKKSEDPGQRKSNMARQRKTQVRKHNYTDNGLWSLIRKKNHQCKNGQQKYFHRFFPKTFYNEILIRWSKKK